MQRIRASFFPPLALGWVLIICAARIGPSLWRCPSERAPGDAVPPGFSRPLPPARDKHNVTIKDLSGGVSNKRRPFLLGAAGVAAAPALPAVAQSTRKSVDFIQVDVFTQTPLEGNPL